MGLKYEERITRDCVPVSNTANKKVATQFGSSSKAKQGYCIYRVRVKRGDRKKRVAKAVREVAVVFSPSRQPKEDSIRK